MHDLFMKILALPSEEKTIIDTNALQQVTDLLYDINQNMALAWRLLFKNEIDNDDLPIITMALLPEDKTTLEKLLEKLSAVCEFSYFGLAAFTLTNLYSAVSTKLSLLPTTQENYLEDRHKRVLALYFCLEKISSVQKICDDYLNYLSNLFAEKLSVVDKISYAYYYGKGVVNPQNVLEKIIDEISNKEDLLPRNETILHIIYKYQTLKYMMATFSYENFNKEQQFGLFSFKFFEFEKLLEKNANKVELGIKAKLQREMPAKTVNTNWYELYRLVPQLAMNSLGLASKLIPQPSSFKNSFNFFTRQSGSNLVNPKTEDTAPRLTFML